MVYHDSMQSNKKVTKCTPYFEWSLGQLWPCFETNHINREQMKKWKTY